MDGPRCGLINPDTAQRCDCGYDFKKGTIEEPYSTKDASIPSIPRLWIGFALAGAFLIAEIIEPIFGYEGQLGPLTTPIAIGGMIYWLFCVHRFHRILDKLTIEGYNTSPGQAVVFHVVPVFNLYWIFKWPIQLSELINRLGNVKMIHGGILGLLLFISFALNRVDTAIGLACIFGVGSYIASKLRRQITFRQNTGENGVS